MESGTKKIKFWIEKDETRTTKTATKDYTNSGTEAASSTQVQDAYSTQFSNPTSNFKRRNFHFATTKSKKQQENQSPKTSH